MEKMNDVLVTIIIPVYNVGQYLVECLESVISQTYTNLEIIIINDGSTDNSLKICEEFKNKDSRIQLVSIQNSGVSGARNIGLSIAKSEYIIFVDSDDYLECTFVQKLCFAIISNNASMAMCSFYGYTNNSITFDGKSRIFDSIMDSTEFLKMVYTYPGFYVPAWNKIYRKELFNNTKYPDRTINEDSQIIREISMQCNRIVTLSEPLYYYRKREGSILTQNAEILLAGELAWIQKDLEYFKSVKNNKLFALTIKLYCSKLIEFFPLVTQKKRYEIIKCYRKRSPQVIINRHISIKSKIKYCFCFISIRLYLQLINKSR